MAWPVPQSIPSLTSVCSPCVGEGVVVQEGPPHCKNHPSQPGALLRSRTDGLEMPAFHTFSEFKLLQTKEPEGILQFLAPFCLGGESPKSCSPRCQSKTGACTPEGRNALGRFNWKPISLPFLSPAADNANLVVGGGGGGSKYISKLIPAWARV